LNFLNNSFIWLSQKVAAYRVRPKGIHQLVKALENLKLKNPCLDPEDLVSLHIFKHVGSDVPQVID
jgi:hypothetical protein